MMMLQMIHKIATCCFEMLLIEIQEIEEGINRTVRWLLRSMNLWRCPLFIDGQSASW